MKRIEDEPIEFYLKHEARIREWAGLEAEVHEFTRRFYYSLKDDLDAALKSGTITDDDIKMYSERGDDPGYSLYRRHWRFPTSGRSICL